MRRALIRRIRAFRAAEDGLAAVELAMILPTLLIVMLGGLQVISYINAVRKVERVVESISQMISQARPVGNSTIATVNASDLHFSFDAAMVLFPYLMAEGKRQNRAWSQVITINYAGITFTQTATNCADSTDQSACYRADVAWTSTGTQQPDAGPAYRPCGTPQIAADNKAPPSRTALPRSLFGPAAMVVIDVLFTFTPTFGARYLPSITIARSAYVQPRYATRVDYDTTNNDWIATKC
ncbi:MULTISPECIES: TadE/TadG family type IV pilus assembly protein [Methylobacterium]|uniref:TadE/TadG family type IV pilus assembly protein n=1 Tax=Methylobacterium TaxID=407 RepID=UPI0013EE23E1|nr:TadE/TadG family type IV pilus assembly protein [Methylobacterium sp. DB0501]NGM38193.1 pilus assembly protein [Methylobacterium sp. DB0501]